MIKEFSKTDRQVEFLFLFSEFPKIDKHIFVFVFNGGNVLDQNMISKLAIIYCSEH